MSREEIHHMVAGLIDELHADPGGKGAALFLERAFGAESDAKAPV